MTESRTFRPRRIQPSRVTLSQTEGWRGRFEVLLDGKSIGWVIKRADYEDGAGTWDAFTKPYYSDSLKGQKVDGGARRLDAVMAVLWAAYSKHSAISLDEFQTMDDESWYLPADESVEV